MQRGMRFVMLCLGRMMMEEGTFAALRRESLRSNSQMARKGNGWYRKAPSKTMFALPKQRTGSVCSNFLLVRIML